MAATGHDWGAWAFIDYNVGTDVDGIAVADEAALISDEISLDKKSACEIAVKLVEDDTGAVASPWVLIQILRGDGVVWQAAATTGPVHVDETLEFTMQPVQAATRLQVFPIDPRDMGSLKVNVVNDCEQELAVTLRIRTADIPVASA